MGAYEAVTGVMDAEDQMENLEVSAEEAQSMKGEAIGSGAGGAGGAMAGMAMGAAVGSVIPVVGTVIGGIVGGALGYFGGSWLGGKAGEAIADAVPVDPGEIAESNEAAEVALKKIEEKDPTLRADIEASAEENYTELLGDKGEDEYSDNDKAAMKNAGLVKAIQDRDADIQALEGGDVDTSKLSQKERTQKAVNDTATAMGIDPADGVEAEIEMGKVVSVNGQAVPEKLQRESTEAMYPGSTPKAKGAAEKGAPVPTGAAVENMTDKAAPAGGAPIINNVTNNTTTPPPANNILTNPPSPRANTSTVERYQDRRYKS